MSFTWSSKDPDEVLDYEHDWAERLGDDDTITSCAAEVDSGTVTIDSQAFSGTKQTVWLSGGEVGDVRLTIRIETAAGRTYDEGIKLKIKER